MKKALQITIAGTLFTIEEDAYQKLDAYLQSIKGYFSSPDQKEIVDDIEARISEQLSEKITETRNIVTIDVVASIIATMGSVVDIAGTPETKTEAFKSDTSVRRLFRNPEDIVIAGVASGMATYFNIDPIIVRIAFVVLTFISSGAMILVYIIIALIIPKAQTPAEKIQMRGGPMTLSSFNKNIGEHVEHVKQNGADLIGRDSGVRRMIEKIFSIFGTIIRGAVKVIIALVGIAFTLGAIFFILAATFIFINLVVNNDAPYLEQPVAQVFNGPLYYFLLVLAYILVVVPLVFIGTIGLSLLRKQRMMKTQSALGLGALWVVAALIAGTLGVRYIPEIHEKYKALPENQVVTESHDLKDFTKLDLNGIDVVTFVQAPEFSVVEEGRRLDLDHTEYQIKDGTLVLSHKNNDLFCFIFCFDRDRVNITVSMPTLESVKMTGATVLKGTATTSDLSLYLDDAASLDMDLRADTLTVDQGGATRITLTGSANTLHLESEDVASFLGEDLNVTTANIVTSGAARNEINASDTLNIEARDASRVFYKGSPKVTEDIDGTAHTERSRD
ncbi:MAG: DUF2807 domain-containing protein [bacterium]|nr:DUF2807 domain-containing protein [bacterium]